MVWEGRGGEGIPVLLSWRWIMSENTFYNGVFLFSKNFYWHTSDIYLISNILFQDWQIFPDIFPNSLLHFQHHLLAGIYSVERRFSGCCVLVIECVVENNDNNDNNGEKSVYFSDFIWDICCFLYILKNPHIMKRLVLTKAHLKFCQWFL